MTLLFPLKVFQSLLREKNKERKRSSYLLRDSSSGFVLSTTQLCPEASAVLQAATHFCQFFNLSWERAEIINNLTESLLPGAKASGLLELKSINNNTTNARLRQKRKSVLKAKNSSRKITNHSRLLPKTTVGRKSLQINLEADRSKQQRR